MTPALFSHGQLRIHLLALLEERPRHGYDLIQALSERFGGTYQPSAGTIYPRLAKLEEEGFVESRRDGRKTVYSITDAGRAELAARLPDLEPDARTGDDLRQAADTVRASVREATARLRDDLASAASESRVRARAQSDFARETPHFEHHGDTRGHENASTNEPAASARGETFLRAEAAGSASDEFAARMQKRFSRAFGASSAAPVPHPEAHRTPDATENAPGVDAEVDRLLSTFVTDAREAARASAAAGRLGPAEIARLRDELQTALAHLRGDEKH